MTSVKNVYERTGISVVNRVVICDHTIGIKILAFSFISCTAFLIFSPVFVSVKWEQYNTSMIAVRIPLDSNSTVLRTVLSE